MSSSETLKERGEQQQDIATTNLAKAKARLGDRKAAEDAMNTMRFG
jgi:hypothetical protein